MNFRSFPVIPPDLRNPPSGKIQAAAPQDAAGYNNTPVCRAVVAYFNKIAVTRPKLLPEARRRRAIIHGSGRHIFADYIDAEHLRFYFPSSTTFLHVGAFLLALESAVSTPCLAIFFPILTSCAGTRCQTILSRNFAIFFQL